MNRIVLIGNGFDLAHGLKTSYKDFIDDYWKTYIERNLEEYVDTVDSIIKFTITENSPKLNTFFNDCDRLDYQQLNLKIKNYTNNSSYGKLLFIKLIINNRFLKHISKKSFNSWLDIENEYFHFLSWFVNPQENTGYLYSSLDNLNSDFLYIKVELEKYLFKVLSEKETAKSKKIQNIISAPFNLQDLIMNERKKIVSREDKRILEYVNREVDPEDSGISNKTIKWIKGSEDYFREGFIDLSKLLIDTEYAKKHFDIIPGNTIFLNFNYTDLEKLYIKKNDDKVKSIHIHGELNSKENPVIFGYGDELEENYLALENKKDNAFLENIKSIKYLEADKYRSLLDIIDSDTYQIIILGHSCGNSDRTLLNTLFEHDNCVSIKPYYYQYKDEKTNEIKDNFSDILCNISRNFKDKTKMRDRVVNKKYCDWFSQDL